MANPRLIKKRVKSIKNINKITKALEMVAASKVQKAQEKAVNAKPFAEKIYQLVQSFASQADTATIPLLRSPKEIRSDLYVLVSTNRGLAGNINTNLFRLLSRQLLTSLVKSHSFITIGKKGRNIALGQGDLLADFSDYMPPESAVPYIIKAVTDAFVEEKVDAVYIVYNDFISALRQDPKIKRLLPLSKEDIALSDESEAFELKGDQNDKEEKGEKNVLYNFEPSPEAVLKELLPFYLEIQMTEILLEAEASEHSARMVAMKNASDNAKELSYNLSLEYNKARQSSITTEINDIVTAGLSLKKHEK